MDVEAVNTVADLIVSKQFDKQLPLYLLQAALLLVISGFGGYLGAYFKKRGQLSAIKADQEKILEQVRNTSRATETIKNDIEHNVWKEKEKITLKTQKLEELIQVARQLNEAHDDMIYDFLNGKVVNISNYPILSGAGSITMLQKLYFPRLEAEVTELMEELAKLQPISFGHEGPREDEGVRKKINRIDSSVIGKYNKLIDSSRSLLNDLYEVTGT